MKFQNLINKSEHTNFYKILYNKIPTYLHNLISNDYPATSFLWLNISVDCFSILFPNSNFGILE